MDLIPGQRLPRVMADRGQVEQVFLNLCLNARDAMLNGGKLAIETEVVVVNGRFRETHPWASPGRYLLISVTDNGVGIPVEALDHVFEPFFTTKPHGTGLGLATVYGIVQRHGGFIHVYSEVGKGTTFKVYLPVAERGAADTGTKVQDPVVGGQETILVAEDEPQVRAVVTRILQRAGYRVLTAEDGDQAVRRFREHQDQIGLVLTDAVMPNKNGADALAEIRAIAPGLPAVLCSGYSDALDRFNNPASGVAFLPKPYEPDVLLRVVRRQRDTRRGS
jgi:CheY-like chemotaxis protein